MTWYIQPIYNFGHYDDTYFPAGGLVSGCTSPYNYDQYLPLGSNHIMATGPRIYAYPDASDNYPDNKFYVYMHSLQGWYPLSSPGTQLHSSSFVDAVSHSHPAVVRIGGSTGRSVNTGLDRASGTRSAETWSYFMNQNVWFQESDRPLAASLSALASGGIVYEQDSSGNPGTFVQYVVWSIGGDTSSGITNQAYAFDVNGLRQFVPGWGTDAWKSIADYPLSVFGAASIFWNSEVWVIGGVGTDGHTTNRVYSYSPANNVWTRRSDLPGPGIFRPALTIVNNGLQIAGGRNHTTIVPSVNSYYLVSPTSAWMLINDPLPFGKYGCVGATFDSNNRAGGIAGQSEPIPNQGMAVGLGKINSTSPMMQQSIENATVRVQVAPKITSLWTIGSIGIY